MYRSTIIDIFVGLLVGDYNIRTVPASPVVLIDNNLTGFAYESLRVAGNMFCSYPAIWYNSTILLCSYFVFDIVYNG